MAQAKRRSQRITSAREILHRRLYNGRPKRIAQRDQVEQDYLLGLEIRRVRESAGLTQQELADLIGTQKSAISRIEDAEYNAHSVETLRRIARACRKRLRIEFVEEEQLQQT